MRDAHFVDNFVVLTILSEIQVCESLTRPSDFFSWHARTLLERTPPSAQAPWSRIECFASSLYGGRGKRILCRRFALLCLLRGTLLRGAGCRRTSRRQSGRSLLAAGPTRLRSAGSTHGIRSWSGALEAFDQAGRAGAGAVRQLPYPH